MNENKIAKKGFKNFLRNLKLTFLVQKEKIALGAVIGIVFGTIISTFILSGLALLTPVIAYSFAVLWILSFLYLIYRFYKDLSRESVKLAAKKQKQDAYKARKKADRKSRKAQNKSILANDLERKYQEK